MVAIKEEKLREGFTKYHLEGLGFDAVIHKLTDEDKDSIHDHPFSFTTHILKGSYIERIYKIFSHSCIFEDVFRAEGTSHIVSADTIHEIIALPQGECTTLILPEVKTREWRFWSFKEGKIMYKIHNTNKWVEL